MNRILVSLFLFLLSFTALAQSDFLCPQVGVPVLTVNSCIANPYNIPTSFGIEPVANVPTGTACVVQIDNKRDGWFQFTATSVTTTIIGTVIAGQDLAIDVYTGACGSMTEVGGPPCQSNGGSGVTETTSLTTIVGTTYFIRLIKKVSATGTMSGTISVLSPQPNDDCSGATTLTPSAPAFPPTCSQTCGHTYNATGSSPTSACAGSANDDVWYQFTATQSQHIITVGGSASFNAVVEVLSGNCGSLTSLGCANFTAAGGIENLPINNFVIGMTYFIRVYDFLATPPATFQFYICVSTPLPLTCPANMGGGNVNVGPLPFIATGLTTTAMGDDFTPSNTITCGNSNYLQGLDGVFIFTPSASGNISVTLTSASTNVGIMLYDGCPFIGSGSNCVANSQSASGNQSFCTNVTSGNTYYLIVDRNTVAGAIPSYSLTITAPASGNTGATCATAVPISLPYTITNQTTLCKGDDYNNASPTSCGSVYESGEDMVFSYTTASAQCIQIALSNTSSIAAGFTVYQGCPSSPSATCLGYVGGGNVSGNFTLPAAGTYYIVVDSQSPPSFVTFNLDVTPSVGNSPNDFPCNATSLPLGVTLPGDNRCTNGELPAAPSCWTSGALNTVWYAVTPSGTSLNIKTILGTLTNTQIALYKGSCASLVQVTPVGSTCNTDETGCGGTTTLNSQMTVTGLTAFQTYYIRVDGEMNLTGTFQIVAVDGNSGLPFITGQDCGAPLSVCQSNIVSNPGYSGNGNYCDNSSSNCTGEVNSVWYTIPINSAGSLSFDIIPNNWPGSPSLTGSDYDFAIWETGASGLTCPQLATTLPTRCNNDVLGVTGCSATGNSPASYPGFNLAYETSIPVAAGQVYKLMVSNNSGSSSGFTFNITSSPDPVSYPSPPANMTWSGGTSTSWDLALNWGACSLPDCGVNVFCTSAPLNQPTLSSNQTVKDVTINAGSTLTINPNITLSVCGNFINGGNLVTGAGSIIKFIGSGNQFIGILPGGNYTGANAFANLTMQKPSGTLTLQANIDIKENDSLLSGLLNTNTKYIRVKKNLYNANGSLTHVSPAPGSTYEFNGNAPQTYTNNGSVIDLNNVFMNQVPASSLTLSAGAFNNLNVLGILTLTNGKIITGAREVVVKNPANAAVINFNGNSYVEGNLRRYLNANATGIYDFPVGHAAKGYQRASINFVSATMIPQLLAYFTPWSVIPVGPVSSECAVANYSLSPALDNGYWTITASASANTGTYNMTLYNLNFTNPASGWTVMKRTPSGSGVWGLNGTCGLPSTALVTIRNGMLGFSDFAVAQSNTPLPIELLRFEAFVKSSGVLISWETASEINNNYFNVERSNDGYNFESIGNIPGAGTSTQHHSYSFPDADPGTGIFYYRLKQVDFDGGYSYSDIVAVKLNSSVNEISIYPNPASSLINFEFESANNSIVNFQIVNMIGKLLIEDSKVVSKGIISSQMDIKNLPEGVYYLKIIENDAVYKGKFVKLDK